MLPQCAAAAPGAAATQEPVTPQGFAVASARARAPLCAHLRGVGPAGAGGGAGGAGSGGGGAKASAGAATKGGSGAGASGSAAA